MQKNASNKMMVIDKIDIFLRTVLGKINKRSSEKYELCSKEYWKSLGYKLAIVDLLAMFFGYGSLVFLLLTLNNHHAKLPIIFITFLICLFIRFCGNMTDKMIIKAENNDNFYSISSQEFYRPIIFSIVYSSVAVIIWYLINASLLN